MLESESISIYVDGSCAGNPGEGAWAAYYRYKNICKFIHGYEKETTNNRMELTAAIQALNNLKGDFTIKIYTDSIYLKNGITLWIKAWLQNNWRNSAKQEVKNRERVNLFCSFCVVSFSSSN
jgi:ribonuclease HI